MALITPLVAWWGRLEVIGLPHLPRTGPTLLVANHDSHWDSLVVGVSARRTRRIEAVAKAELWRWRVVGRVLDSMRQHRITRGRADRAELAEVVGALRVGRCVGIFPEGGLSHGQKARAYSGAGWLAKSVPGTTVVCVAITGAADFARFPRRPRLCVEFFPPLTGPATAGEPSVMISRRWLAEIRDRAPAVGRPPRHERRR